MIRRDLIAAIHRKYFRISQQDANGVLNIILEQIKTSLASGESVTIPNFGRFEVAAKKCRMPDGTVILRTVIHFYPAKALKDQVNAETTSEAG